ncbi:MAG: hypothetical protein K2G29_11285 [Muribaculaceae bacterium]|nr:hypothetical protein [Muribaculaceae bacterium]
MKTLSIIFYAIGFILLIISCFTTSIAVTWWLGGCAVVALIVGCVCQFNANTHSQQFHYNHRD